MEAVGHHQANLDRHPGTLGSSGAANCPLTFISYGPSPGAAGFAQQFRCCAGTRLEAFQPKPAEIHPSGQGGGATTEAALAENSQRWLTLSSARAGQEIHIDRRRGGTGGALRTTFHLVCGPLDEQCIFKRTVECSLCARSLLKTVFRP